MEIFRYICVKNCSFWIYWFNCFSHHLKIPQNNTQMTEAMKLTHLTGVGISSFQQCSHKGGSLNSVVIYYGIRKEQGKRYGQTGNETACNRERDGMSLNSNARPHKLGRAPLYLGAPALICWSGRSKPSFIL